MIIKAGYGSYKDLEQLRSDKVMNLYHFIKYNENCKQFINENN